jgi:hypothetical protein
MRSWPSSAKAEWAKSSEPARHASIATPRVDLASADRRRSSSIGRPLPGPGTAIHAVGFAAGAGRLFFTLEDRQSDICVAEVKK